ncbi:PREDICTED: uncharacterized protein LOC109124977 [Camelina sativa]|uniref:Floricaula/leafy-like transcription factor n=1 Tax=Camelina sativa TaxID=90675 RepID=A0ABM1R9I7_CAMSA|nr:PREDICTED: uncharacterized protein LOC109124977 [Camelina sativa]
MVASVETDDDGNEGEDDDGMDNDDWTGLSEEPVQQQDQTDAAGNNGGYWEAGQGKMKKLQPQRRRKKPMVASVETDDDGNEGEDDDGMDNGNGVGGGSSGGLGTERQREHPFIVTEPGEVARGKKNGLDYLFHLYEQCREFLLQVQTIAKDRGEKCPTKGRYHMDTAQNGTPSGDLNNQILSSKEENYAAKVESAGKEILHKHKGQLRQLIHMLRQIETQVNSHQEEILQMVDDRRTFFQDFIQKSLYYLSSVHSKNHDTFPVTVKLLRVLFNNINEVLGSVDTGVNDLMQALAKNMCHPMTKYVGNLAAELKLGPCVELMNVVNEMERANADTRRELKDARERIRLAEETKIESLLKLKKAEDHVQRMTTSAKFLLPSSQNKKQAEHSITGKRIGTEGGREHEEKLLWELLSKRRKQQEPESPMGPKELIRQADTKQKPLVYIRRSTRLNSQKARPDSLIPLGLSPSARTVTWR